MSVRMWRPRRSYTRRAKFPAAAFPMEIYQELGSMRGGVGTAVKLARVKAEDVRFLSRKYWIDRIDLAPPEKK